jgi:EmrB/QacA subfamily drug resistance transporter
VTETESATGTDRAAATDPATGKGSAPRHLGVALAVIGTAQLMVVLDASIVNVALPSIQRALHFGGANLEWVINAYTLAFGGLLLLGGRTGDLFGRRRMFGIGVGLFTVASLLGGLATSQAWLIAARAAQGVGGAIASPTALSLVAANFREGRERNRAMGVYSAMSGAGGAIGVLLGGILTSTISWRWVLFVNVPIGLVVIALAPRVLVETDRQKGRLDLVGALTATAGMSLLVYGLVHAATHEWGNPGTVIPIVLAGILLPLFVYWETRVEEPLMPLHLFADRSRSGAYGVMLAIGTSIFAMFYFLTLFMQDVLGFSALKTGVAYLPFAIAIMIVATITARVVTRVGARAPIMVGTLLGSGGLFWMSQVSPHSTYLGSVIGPMLLVASGMASCFVPLTITTVSGVAPHESGIASALLNSGQQVGGSLGLAVLGTIAATVTRNHLTSSGFPALSKIPAGAGPVLSHLPPKLHQTINEAFTHGYSVAFRVGSIILLVAFLVATLTIRPRPAAVAAGAAAPVPA